MTVCPFPWLVRLVVLEGTLSELVEQTVFLFSKVKDVFNTIDTSGSGRLGHQDVSYLRVLVSPSLCHPHFLSLMSCCVCDDSGMLTSKSVLLKPCQHDVTQHSDLIHQAKSPKWTPELSIWQAWFCWIRRQTVSYLRCRGSKCSVAERIIMSVADNKRSTLCPKKTCDYIFYNNFNSKCPITIIFGIVSSKSMRYRKMVSFATSPI